jgi:hypothetical protein
MMNRRMLGRCGSRIGAMLFLLALGGPAPARGEDSLQVADIRHVCGVLRARQDSLGAAYDSLHDGFYACGSPATRKRFVAQMAEIAQQIKSVRQAWPATRGDPLYDPPYVVWDSMWADPYPAIEESLRIPAELFRERKVRRKVEQQQAGCAVTMSVLTCQGTWLTITNIRALDGSFTAADTAYVAVSGDPSVRLFKDEGSLAITCDYEMTNFGREFFVILEQDGRAFRILYKGFPYGDD